MTKRSKLISLLKKEFPKINGICASEELGYSKGAIHLGDCAEGGEIDDLPACDYYDFEHDPQEKIYVLGVHKKLAEFVEKHGWYVECWNPGVYQCYEA